MFILMELSYNYFKKGQTLWKKFSLKLLIHFSFLYPFHQAKTSFERLWYADGVSVIRCKPETGRMHQIRSGYEIYK